MKNKDIAITAAAAWLAIVLGYVETFIPIPIPIPGIKLGLSNLAILFALYKLSPRHAWYIMLIKILVSSLLFSGFQSFLYSLSGGILSLFIMTISKKHFSVIGVSVLGGVFHNIGQLSAAAFVLKSTSVFWYLPPLLISGVITGFLIGTVCNLVLTHIK